MQSENRSCEAVRRLLDCYVSSELTNETNLDILDHLDSCPACSAALDSRVQARSTLKQAVQNEAAPAELLTNIRSALPRKNDRVVQQWAIAAVILLGLFLGGTAIWHVQPRKNSASTDTQRTLDLGLAVYQNCPAEAGLDSLGWEYGGLVDAIGEEKPSNYEIIAAHRCMFEGRLFVNVVLERGDSRVSFVVTEKEHEQFSDWDRSRAFEASGVPVYGNTIGGHQIAVFETGRHLAFVISELTGDANLRLASSIAALYAPSIRSTQKEARNGH